MLAVVDDRTPREEGAGTFSVSTPSIECCLKRRRETGGVEPNAIPGRPPLEGAALAGRLPKHLEGNPNLTLAEHRKASEGARGTKVSAVTVGRAIARSPGGWPLKKSRP